MECKPLHDDRYPDWPMNVTARTPDNSPFSCPACGSRVVTEPLGLAGDTPCAHCGRLLWFLRKPLGEVVVLMFLPGLVAGSDSGGRVDEVVASAGTPPRMVLDVSQLRVVSSLFLGMLVGVNRRVAVAQGALKICGLNAVNMGIIRTTKLDTILDICDDEAQAVEGCRPRPDG